MSSSLFNENDYLVLKHIANNTNQSINRNTKRTNKEGIFIFTPNDIQLKHLTPSKTVYINLAIRTKEIEKYICHNTIEVGLSIETLHKIFKMLKQGGTINIYISRHDTNKIQILYINDKEGKQFKCSLNKFEIEKLDIDTDQCLIYENNTISIPTEQYNDICKSIKTFSSEIQIEYVNQSIIFRGTDKITNPEICLHPDDLKHRHVIKSNEIVQQTFDIIPFLAFMKSTGKVISISIQNDMPLTLQTEIAQFISMTMIIINKTDID